jgi:hypothetical protein
VSAGWHVEQDVLFIGAMRLVMQRTGLRHMQHGVRPRSWGVAPLHAAEGAVLVPCWPGEALWLGAWTEDALAPAIVSIEDRQGATAASIRVPPQERIAELLDAGGGAHFMIVPSPPLELYVDQGAARAQLDLVLLAPATWAARSGRVAPSPRSHPPPLPPRLG